MNVYVNDDDVRFEEGLETATPDGAGRLDHSRRRGRLLTVRRPGTDSP